MEKGYYHSVLSFNMASIPAAGKTKWRSCMCSIGKEQSIPAFSFNVSLPPPHDDDYVNYMYRILLTVVGDGQA